MRKYIAFFRMRFIAGLQYRAAALAGIATQFAWGGLSILMYKAFYQADPGAFPMSFQALSSYIWLQQALLALFMSWFIDNELLQLITNGGIAYELCRPIRLYNMWMVRTMADRLSKALLRCLPILLVAGFLPAPYGMTLPVNISAAIWFAISLVLGFMVVMAYCMVVYMITFFTISPLGVRIISSCLDEFLSGAVIPLPFFPTRVRQVIEALPFASMQNVPLRIYSGDISGSEIYYRVGLQIFWLIAILAIGRLLAVKALKKVIVQGG